MEINDMNNVALFLYNRPAETMKTLEALFLNENFRNINLHIFIDGPKNKFDVEKQIDISNIINEFYQKESNKVDNVRIKVNHSLINYGLAHSIINGVSTIFKNENCDFLIVLEDDIVTSNIFLTYMKIMDEKFREDEMISTISAFNPISEEVNSDPLFKDVEAFLHQRSSSWGWGTWRNKWDKNIWSIDELYIKLNNNLVLKDCLKRESPDILPMLDDQKNKRIDSWAVRWVVSQYINNFYTVYPKKSLIQNIGFGKQATHTNVNNKKGYLQEPVRVIPNYENTIKISKKINKIFYSHYKMTILQKTSFILKKIGLYSVVKISKKIRKKTIK